MLSGPSCASPEQPQHVACKQQAGVVCGRAARCEPRCLSTPNSPRGVDTTPSYAVLRPRESCGEILLVGSRNRQTPPSPGGGRQNRTGLVGGTEKSRLRSACRPVSERRPLGGPTTAPSASPLRPLSNLSRAHAAPPRGVYARAAFVVELLRGCLLARSPRQVAGADGSWNHIATSHAESVLCQSTRGARHARLRLVSSGKPRGRTKRPPGTGRSRSATPWQRGTFPRAAGSH